MDTKSGLNDQEQKQALVAGGVLLTKAFGDLSDAKAPYFMTLGVLYLCEALPDIRAMIEMRLTPAELAEAQARLDAE